MPKPASFIFPWPTFFDQNPTSGTPNLERLWQDGFDQKNYSFTAMSLSDLLTSRLGSPSTPLRQVTLDSLEVIELIMEIEERYAVAVDECELLKDQTVSELSEKLELQINGRDESPNVL
jgi:regulator of replication initiation timing